MKITLNNCSKSFVKEKRNIQVLDHLSYTFTSSHFYAIMGPSGSGKSTFLNIIAGLYDLTEGQIYYDQKIIKGDYETARLRNSTLGLVYQSFLLNENMTAIENVMLPLHLNKQIKKQEKIARAKTILTKLGLGDRLNHYPKELSGGEQQRVAIARALINSPQVLLADEPTGNLDKKNEKYIFNLFKELANRGICVIVVSHNEKIKDYADIILNLKDGKLYEEK